VIPQSGPKKLPYVTKLLPGEFKSVPDACKAISATVLSSALPGPGLQTTQSASGASDSQCTFTLDHRPDFLVLEVTAQAYQPFAAATGNGSASQNALDNHETARQTLAQHTKGSPLPAAAITTLANLGQKAFSAFQRERAGGIVTDVVTVNVLDRNVLITVIMQGQESGHGFGPVPPSDLQTGASSAAGSVLAQVRTQPTA
jgi:CheY-like chemotaxis protein